VAGIGSRETDQCCIVYVSVRPDLRFRTRHCLAAILVFIMISYRIVLGNKGLVFPAFFKFHLKKAVLLHAVTEVQ